MSSASSASQSQVTSDPHLLLDHVGLTHRTWLWILEVCVCVRVRGLCHDDTFLNAAAAAQEVLLQWLSSPELFFRQEVIKGPVLDRK